MADKSDVPQFLLEQAIQQTSEDANKLDESLDSTVDGSIAEEADGGGTGDSGGNDCTVIRIDEHQVKSLLNTSSGETSSSPGIKIGTSHKFPSLKKYYEFGPWVGRNRKAVCLACKLQTSSSQPDRLLRHLNKCASLTEEDKVNVREMMNERTANKRKSPGVPKYRRENDYDPVCEDDDHCQKITVPKRVKMDRNAQIDEALTRFIMMCRVPLKTIHSKEFVDLVKLLHPDYQIPSRETITNILIPGLLNII